MHTNFNEEPRDKLKKLINVPSFIRERSQCKSKDLSVKSKGKFATNKEFEQITLTDPHLICQMKKRMQKWIKGTPKVTVLCQKNNSQTFKISSASKSFFSSIAFLSEKVRLQKIIEVVSTLFRLVDEYGYFYCDKEMIRMSSEGIPIVWVHQNFCCSFSELPIKQSSVSQLIFIKKMKQTFGEIVKFPKNIQIQNKIQLLVFLEEEEKKILEQNSFISHKNTLKKYNSNGNHNHTFIHKFPSFRSISPPNFQLFTNQFYHQNHQKIKFVPSYKNICNQKNNNKRKCKKSKTVNYQNSFSSDFDSQKKSQICFIGQKQFSDHSDLYKRSQTGSLNKLNCHPKSVTSNKNNKKMQEIQHTINDEFNFQPKFIIQPKSLKLNKNRKQSVQIKNNHWIKKQTNNTDKTYENSTFSTRVTLSSMKGEFQNEIEIKTKKNTVKQSKFYERITSASQQICSKDKIVYIFANNKNLQQSGIKISQENSFENQFQNLFQFEQNTNKQNVRESLLIQEFDKLFDDAKSENLQFGYMEDFMAVLQ